MLLLQSGCLYAQDITAYKPRLLRFDEDYSRIGDSIRNTKIWLRTKNRSFDGSGSIKASYGFDYREMYELIKGYDARGVSDGYWLTRLMAHGDIHFGKRFRTFAQIGRGIVAEGELPIRPVDKDELFLLNGFADYRFDKEYKSYIRFGRQELFFGMGRLIAPREGPNIRNTYNGLRVHKAKKAIIVDGFFTYIVNNKPGIFDNNALGNNQRLWGLYTAKKSKIINTDVYYIGFYNPTATYTKQATRSKEERHSVGARFYGKALSAFNYDAELVYQFGTFGTHSIVAFLGDAKVYSELVFGNSVFKPSLKFTYASGNRSATDNKLTTYNPLFPNLLYYQTAIGIFPSNLINPQLGLEWKYKKLTNAAGADVYWRASNKDGLYAPFGTLNLNGKETYLGYQFFIKTDYEAIQNLGFTFLLSRYYKSSLVQANADGRGIDLLLNILLNYKL